MADLALLTTVGTSAAPTFPNEARRRNYKTNEAVAQGQALYIVAASGKVGLADANASGKHQFLGIAMETKGSGETVSVLEQGDYYGFDLSGMNYDAPVYLSDTAGALADAAGSASVVCGKVRPINQVHAIVKALYIFSAPNIVQA